MISDLGDVVCRDDEYDDVRLMRMMVIAFLEGTTSGKQLVSCRLVGDLFLGMNTMIMMMFVLETCIGKLWHS